MRFKSCIFWRKLSFSAFNSCMAFISVGVRSLLFRIGNQARPSRLSNLFPLSCYFGQYLFCLLRNEAAL
ncbi:hypothetical protein FHS76_003986 [Ochrobactrum daejeonense]|uniref:Uncharacterized protein n=1 Tax=Brucella daejeonensis TaxID=659015 RepID=A0A7W9EPR4_9HYPH|nr:hypothetical protein [Brucella daejeonensis]